MIFPTINAERLQRFADTHGYGPVHVLPEVDSTHAWIRRELAAGRPLAPLTIVTTEDQQAGRGRHQRTWVTPAGTAIALSIYLEPGQLPLNTWSWLTMMLALSVNTALQEHYHVAAELKWPNDVLVAPGNKICGVLAEILRTSGPTPALVVGCGLNVHQNRSDIPNGGVSLASLGCADVDRNDVIERILTTFKQWYDRWLAAAGDAVTSGLHAAVTKHCATLRQECILHLPDGSTVLGQSAHLTTTGALHFTPHTGDSFDVSAADVEHCRPTNRSAPDDS